MRKYHIFLSLCVVFAFLLAACGSSTQNVTSTAVGGIPVTGNETGTVVAPGNTETSATSGTTETSVAPGTTETTGTEQSTQAGGTTATVQGTTETTPSTTLTPSGQVDPGLLTNEMQFQVVDKNNAPLGQVKDFVLDLTKMQIAYVVVDLSQSSGSTMKEVAVPWHSMQVQNASGSSSSSSSTASATATATTSSSSGGTTSTGTPEATSSTGGSTSTGTPAATSSTGGSSGSAQGNFKGTFVFTGDAAMLNNAPDFSAMTLPQFGQDAANWDASIVSYWSGNGSSSTPSSTPTASATMNMTETATATSSSQQSGASLLQGVVLASKVIGMNVMDSNSQQLAQVTDFVVNVNTGDLTYVLLTVNNKLVPVPLQMFKMDAQNQNFVLGLTSDVLKQASGFDMGAFPMTTSSGWDTAVKVFWNNLSQSGQSGQSTQSTSTTPQATSTP